MSLPPWESLHPMVVHFPIALLMVAPLFAVLTLIFPKGRLSMGLAALVLMLLGTCATYVAFATGEANESRADGVARAEAVLEAHEEAAELTRIVFTLLTAIYATILLLPVALKRDLPRASSMVVGLAFLLLYAGGVTLLVEVGHQGARLVHEFGIHAAMDQTNDGTSRMSMTGIPIDREEHDEDE